MSIDVEAVDLNTLVFGSGRWEAGKHGDTGLAQKYVKECPALI